MRIGYIATLARPPVFGVGKCIRRVFEHLAPMLENDELTLYTTEDVGWPDEELAGVKVHRIPRIARLRIARIAWEQLRSPDWARREGIDLIHSPYVLPVPSSVPGVLGLFDLISASSPSLCRPGTRLYNGLLGGASIRRSAHILVPAGSVRRDLVRHFAVDEDRISIVPLGIDDGYRKPPPSAQVDAVRRRYALHGEFVLFAGRLEPKKNLARLLAAFAMARQRGLRGELAIAGELGWGGAERRLRGDGRARWLGYVPDEDLRLLFHAASEFVFPSLAEGFGLPPVEAMACGCVVVSSRVPSVREFAAEDAYVAIDPESETSLCEGLLRARGDAALRKHLSSRGPGAVADLTWERTARDTLAVYRRYGRA